MNEEYLELIPDDCQTVINLLKANSKKIELEIMLRQAEKKKRIAECKEYLKERRNEEHPCE